MSTGESAVPVGIGKEFLKLIQYARVAKLVDALP